MDDEIYGERVKALAAAAHGAGTLAEPQGRGRADSPLCGDRAVFEVRLDADGRVEAVAHQVRGCLICRASASALAVAAPGRTPDAVQAAADALKAMLTADPPPAAPFAEGFADFAAFAPLRRHRSRHDCALVPFRAATAALAQAGQGQKHPAVRPE